MSFQHMWVFLPEALLYEIHMQHRQLSPRLGGAICFGSLPDNDRPLHMSQCQDGSEYPDGVHCRHATAYMSLAYLLELR